MTVHAKNPAIVNAGADGSVCIGGSYTLYGQVDGATQIVWSQVAPEPL